jgi:hypothetical protein
MPSKKISQLNNVPTPAPTDVLPIVQGNITYKVTVEDAVNSLVVLNTDLSTDSDKLTDRATIKAYVDAIIPSQTGNPDKYLTTNGTTVSWDDPIGYKVYTAIITQSGTAAPVPTVLKNTLGATINWSRASAGRFDGDATGIFTNNKTIIFINNNDNSFAADTSNYTIKAFRLNINRVNIYKSYSELPSTQTYSDDININIEIRVYP